MFMSVWYAGINISKYASKNSRFQANNEFSSICLSVHFLESKHMCVVVGSGCKNSLIIIL